jgi:hypothetical protein
VGINKYFKDKPKEYLLHPRVSRYLAVKKLRQELEEDAKKYPEC